MRSVLKLPIGIEDFEEMRTEGFYYVDKTGLIADLLNNWGKVNLFTRPRRFGKSLNMSMLRYFFSRGCDPALFEGLAISREKELCERYMSRFPVIFITLKDVAARDFEKAAAMMSAVIGEEAMRFLFLKESAKLSAEEIAEYSQLVTLDTSGRQKFLMSADTLEKSLRTLSRLLCKHYGQKVILLIDMTLKLFSPVKMLSLEIRRHPVSTAKYICSFVFRAWLNRPRIRLTISS